MTRAGPALVIQAGTATSTRLRDEEQSFNRIDIDGDNVTLTRAGVGRAKFAPATRSGSCAKGDHWRIAGAAIAPMRTDRRPLSVGCGRGGRLTARP